MKTSRIQLPAREPKSFGLFAVVESRRVQLPLKGVECDFTIASGSAEVSMTQIFRQENPQPLDCDYLFPLPADAAVYACEADINGRTIRAKVCEREEARRLAEQMKTEGFRTALVEAERENLFTLSLGNVQPGDLVVVRLKYFQTLRFLADRASIEIPFCPGVRYTPGNPLLRANKGKGVVDDTDQVPDASRITPVRIDASHPDAAYVEVRGNLDARFVDEGRLASPSHSITTERTEDRLFVSLADKSEVPDRDFVLRWAEKSVEAVASRAWFVEKGRYTYALMEIRAPEAVRGERPPVDFYFLVDRSGSMNGRKWDQAVKALQSCVAVLGAGDRAMVTLFESEFRDFAERPLSPAQLMQDREFRRLGELGTGGGTELGRALQHVLQVAAKHSEKGRPKNLILITDAQVGDDEAILELMRDASGFPVHCFGIDVALNDSLLLALCRQQGGTFHSLHPNDDIERAVTALGKTLSAPVLLRLRLPHNWELARKTIPDLYAGQRHYLSARLSGGSDLKLRALTPAAKEVRIPFERQEGALDAPYLHWCRSRIQRLVAEGKNSDAIALSVESNLVCPLTAFIAWDESERVARASHDLVQPPMLAHRLISRTCLFHRLSADDVAPAALRLSLLRPKGAHGDVDPLFPLELELTILCSRAGVPRWDLLVKEIVSWVADAAGEERTRRLERVRGLIKRLEARIQTVSRVLGQREVEPARAKIQALLESFVRDLHNSKASAPGN